MIVQCRCKRSFDGTDDIETMLRRVQAHCDKSYHHKDRRITMSVDLPLSTMKIAISFPRAGYIGLNGRDIIVDFTEKHDSSRIENGQRE